MTSAVLAVAAIVVPATAASAAGPSRAPAGVVVAEAPPAGLYLAIAGVIVLAVVAMIALGDAGEPGVQRRGSVLRALERRDNPADPEESL